MAKRSVYVDGWHEKNEHFGFYVENGELRSGVVNDGYGNVKAVYPYKFSKKMNCYDNCYGCTARYGILKSVRWF